MSNCNEIMARLRTLPVGTKVVYHEGFLINAKSKEVRAMTNAIYDLYLQGFYALTQKKVCDFRYQYIATVLSPVGREAREKRNKAIYETAHQQGSKRSTHYRARIAKGGFL